jgi:hypothetical protein
VKEWPPPSSNPYFSKYVLQLINKTTNVMQLGAIVFIIPWKALGHGIVLHAPDF